MIYPDKSIKEGEPASPVVDTNYEYSDEQLRIQFIKDVFLIVTGQVIFTFVLVLIYWKVELLKREMKDPGTFISAIIFIWCFYVIIACSYGVTHIVPYNYIVLICLTIVFTFVIAHVCFDYQFRDILIGMGILILLCIVLSIGSYSIPFDLIPMMIFLFPALIILLVLLIIKFVVLPNVKSLSWACIIIGIILLSMFYAVDVQLITQDRHKYIITSKDYIFGATLLYADLFTTVIYIFVMLRDLVHSA